MKYIGKIPIQQPTPTIPTPTPSASPIPNYDNHIILLILLGIGVLICFIYFSKKALEAKQGNRKEEGTTNKEESRKQKNGINKTAILVALILGLSVIGYGYMNISYKNKIFEAEQAEKARERLAEEAEKTKQEKEEELNRLMREACFTTAEATYKENWKSNCEARGLKEDCLLPPNLADRLDDSRDGSREECFKKYPVE